MSGDYATEKKGVRAILSLGTKSSKKIIDAINTSGNKRETKLFHNKNGESIPFIVIGPYSIITKNIIAEVEAFDEETNEEFINYVKNIQGWKKEALETENELPIPEEILKKSPAAIAILDWWDSVKE